MVMTTYEMQELMGNYTTEAEAEAMLDILQERGINVDAVEYIEEREFFRLVSEAVQRAHLGGAQ